ncbi:MAG TPA: V-type ATP synthase subunit D [Acidimicrobiales bacterium]|nr:V-type ATP synthase subunit D [Acidimicrobiales bacterium]
MTVRVPPGRAGRLWLQERLGVARRAADLLARKERLLQAEERRIGADAEDAAREWVEAWREAEAWTGRAAVLGGDADLVRYRAAGGNPAAAARVGWHNTMGITYPSGSGVVLPDPPPAAWANAALPRAAAANRQAVASALRHAAAAYARSQVQAELAATRRRRRAVTERWLPELERALSELEARLDELEREEHVRSRWARLNPGRRPPTASAGRSAERR